MIRKNSPRPRARAYARQNPASYELLENRYLLAFSDTGAISAIGQEVLFDFLIGEDDLGQPFRFVVDGDNTLHPTLDLLSPSGEVLLSGSSARFLFDTMIDGFVPTSVADGGLGPGIYQLRVSSFDDALGFFEIGASDLHEELPLPIDFSSFVPGVIEHTADQDRFVFSARAGDVVQLFAPGTGFTTDLTLRGPGGFVAGGGRDDRSIRATLPEDGEYVVTVSASGATGVGHGPYLLSLSDPRPEVANIGFGEQVRGSIHAPGDFTEFDLDVTASEVGSLVSIVVTPPPDPFGQVIDVFDPNGVRVVQTESSRSFSTSAVEVDDLLLAQAGTYRIRVSDSGNDNTGDFVIAVSDQPIRPPNPLPGFNTTVTGRIELMGDVDEYVFDGASGQILTFERLSGSFDITLLRSDGSVVTGGGNNDRLLDLVTLPADDAYRIRIEPAGGTINSLLADAGPYSFAVWAPEREPDPIPISFGEGKSGQVTWRGDIVDYSLEAGPEHVGKPVSIVATAPQDPFGTILELFGPDDARLAVAETNRAFGVNAVEIDDFIIPAAGTYRLRVRDTGNDAVGSFTIGVSDQPIDVIRELPAFGATINGAINHIGDVDDYVFPGVAGELATIRLQSTQFVDFTLFASDGTVVAGGGSTDSLLQLVQLPADDQYRLRIEPRGGTVSSDLGRTGSYQFVVTMHQRGSELIPIGFGDSASGEIRQPGDVVEYGLTVGPDEVGKAISITLSPPADPFGQFIDLYSPSGELIASSGTNRTFNVNSVRLDRTVLSEQGTYRIRVRDLNHDHTGRFVIGVSDEPIELATPLSIGSKSAGILETVGDTDVYSLTSNTGERITVSAFGWYPPRRGLQLRVLDEAGQVVTQVDNADVPSVSFTPITGETYSVLVAARGPGPNAYLDERFVYQIDISDASNPASYLVDDGALGELSLGGMAVGTIDTATDVDAYAFEGIRGETVQLVVANGANDATNNFLSADMRLLGPGNIELLHLVGGENQHVRTYTLPADGMYRIEVAGGGSLGPYAVGVSDGIAERLAPRTLESGDRIGGAFDPVADEDLFVFDYADGERVDLIAWGGPRDVPVVMQVYSPIGTPLYTYNGTNIGLRDTTLPESGQYLVRLTPTGRLPSNYQLDFQKRAAAEEIPPSSYRGEPSAPFTGHVGPFVRTLDTVPGEDNVVVPPLPAIESSFDTRGPTQLVPRTTVVGQFPSGSGRHVFQVDVNAGEVLFVSVEATDRFDSGLQIFDPNGVVIGSQFSGVNSRLGRVAYQTGTYEVVVTGSGDGGYQITSSISGERAGVALTLDGPAITDVFDDPADEHIYTFAIAEPTTIDLSLLPANGALLDSRIELVTPSGHRRIASGGTASVFDNLHLLETGSYRLLVRPDTGEGGYSIQLRSGSAVTIEPAPNATVEFGQTVAGAINNAGDVFDVSFVVGPGHVGRPVSITATAAQDPFGQVVELFGPDNVRLTVNSTNRAFNQVAVEIDDFVLAVEGIYTIRVRDTGNDNTGSFTIGVSDQPSTDPTDIPSFNQTISGNIDAVADVDEYRFTGTARTGCYRGAIVGQLRRPFPHRQSRHPAWSSGVCLVRIRGARRVIGIGDIAGRWRVYRPSRTNGKYRFWHRRRCRRLQFGGLHSGPESRSDCY